MVGIIIIDIIPENSQTQVVAPCSADDFGVSRMAVRLDHGGRASVGGS